MSPRLVTNAIIAERQDDESIFSIPIDTTVLCMHLTKFTTSSHMHGHCCLPRSIHKMNLNRESSRSDGNPSRTPCALDSVTTGTAILLARTIAVQSHPNLARAICT